MTDGSKKKKGGRQVERAGVTEIYGELQRCSEAEGCVMDGGVVMKEMREPGLKDRWIIMTLHS